MQINTADHVGVIKLAGEAANTDAALVSGRVIRPCVRQGRGMRRRRP
jgi:hypothetical protein